MTRVLITGANGFVGQQLCSFLGASRFEVIPVARSQLSCPSHRGCDAVIGKVIDARTDWKEELADVDVVIHLAAKVHSMGFDGSDDRVSFRQTNVEGTRNLAVQAAQLNVKRFVYLSSIKVNGERTYRDPFTPDQVPRPAGAYAMSKLEAEIVLREVEEREGLEVVIIRPPLIYGPGAKGNLAVLGRIINTGVPLPFGAMRNRRDLVSIYNLCDLIKITCLHPEAAGRTFLVSDGQPISTVELIRHMAKGMGRRARLFFFPMELLKFAARVFGRSEMIEKLSGNLEIDLSMTQQALGWKPPYSVVESFEKMYADG